jgi:hypothetical protein
MKPRVAALIGIAAVIALYGIFTSQNFNSHAEAALAKKLPSPADVVVAVLSAPLPHDKMKRADFLWDSFANKPEEEQFSSVTTENWESKFKLYENAIVRKASKKKLDTASLVRALAIIQQQGSEYKLAYLPVGAYQTTFDGVPVWIVTVKWETAEPFRVQHLPFAHLRMFAFDQGTLKLVGFNTCG